MVWLVSRSRTEEGIMKVLSEGQTIRHEQYGIGIVMESNNDRTTSTFLTARPNCS